MTAVSGCGPWPGTDALEAVSAVVGDLAEVPAGVDGLPFTPLLAARGPWGDATGRAVALLAELTGELGPHGWQLADRPGGDLARARALVREDLDAAAVGAHGYDGTWVVPVLGPVTLAARLWLARGDRVVSDVGALRELAAASAAGLGEHLADLVRAVPGVRPTVLLHEPLLAQVVAGVLPSFSGYARLRAVPGPVVGELLAAAVTTLRSAGAGAVVLHVGTATTAVRAAGAAKVDGVGLTLAGPTGLDDRGWEHVAEAVEAGVRLWAQLPPQASSQCAGPDVRGQADVLLRGWRRVGLPAKGLADVVLLDGGLAGAVDGGGTPDLARGALAGLARAATIVAEVAEG